MVARGGGKSCLSPEPLKYYQLLVRGALLGFEDEEMAISTLMYSD
jgi:hypothetical protein